MRRNLVLSLLLCALALTLVRGACLAEEDKWAKPITLELKDIEPSAAFTKLFAGTGMNYSISQDISEIPIPSLRFNDVPFHQALDNLAKATGTVYRVERGIVMITAKPGNATPVVNLDVKDMPLPEVIDAIFKGSGRNYVIDPAINPLKVTAVLKNVTLITALKQVLKAAGAAYRIESNTYNIGPKLPVAGTDSPVQGSSPYDGGPISGKPLAPESAGPWTVEKLPLRYVEPGDVIPMLTMDRRDGYILVMTSGPGFVVVGAYGERPIMRAKDLLKMVDTEPPVDLRIPVRIKLIARATVTADGKPSKTYEATTESTGTDGSEMPLLMLSSTGSNSYHFDLRAVLTPTILKNGGQPVGKSQGIGPSTAGKTISLSGEGSIVSDSPTRFSKSFQVGAAVAPGEKTIIAAGSAEMPTAKIEFTVTAIATIEKGLVAQPKKLEFGSGGGGPEGPPPPQDK